MKPLPQITFRNFAPSKAIEEKINKEISKLFKYSNNIIKCTVVVGVPHRHKHQGNLFSVRIKIEIPGHDIIVTQHTEHDHRDEDFYLALHDALKTARRNLKDHTRIRCGAVKTHARPAIAYRSRSREATN